MRGEFAFLPNQQTIFMKCINYYIGGSCNNDANPDNILFDGYGYPLHYCDKCFKRMKGDGC